MNNTRNNPLRVPAPAQLPSPPLPWWAQAIGCRRAHRRERRGVLLLLMLCLLVLFAVLGVTYVLVASQFRRSTAGQTRIEQYAPDYRNQLDEAAMQVFRGSTSPLSVLSNHSLLEDMYGNDSLSSASLSSPSLAPATTVTIYSAASSFTGTTPGQPAQLIDLTLESIVGSGMSAAVTSTPLPWPLASYFTGSGTTNPAPPITGNPPYFNNSAPSGFVFTQNSVAPSGFFNGCVLTFTSGPAAGQSTRIVGYDNGLRLSTGHIPTLRVTDFPGSNALVTASHNNAVSGTSPIPSLGVQFVINGRPFNGTGFGFNAAPNSGATQTFGLVNAIDVNNNLFALLPNPVTFNSSGAAQPYPVVGGIGGADEDYDAADWNNMLLGLSRHPLDSGLPTVTHPPYPSLHRPELVNYWVNNLSAGSDPNWLALARDPTNGFNASPANLAVMRQVLLRPIGYVPPGGAGGPIKVDHPNFTGSNSNPAGYFDPINGPWDVDNDGDGVADSVWVDLGGRVQTAPDGTTYKPLYAIRVLDMDGRLNVNAHGNSAQAETTFASPISGYFTPTAATVAPLTTPAATPALGQLTLETAATATPTAQYPAVGSGYGTAEINLMPLFTEQSSLGTTIAQQRQYSELLGGTPTAGAQANTSAPIYEGRYGESSFNSNYSPSATYTDAQAFTTNTTPSSYPTTFPPQAGLTNLHAAVTNYANSGSITPTGNPLSFIKFWDYPVPGYPTALTSFGSPADLWGRGLMALDINGTPLAPYMSNQPYVVSPTSGTSTIAFSAANSTLATTSPGGQYDTLNNPYTLNLSHSAVRGARPTGATDNPFTPGELERLLRAYDADAGALPPRLATLLDKSLGTTTGVDAAMQNLRQQVTTDSFDLPSPSIATTNDLRTAGGVVPVPPGTTLVPLALSPADLLTARLRNGGVSTTLIPTELALMLPPELIAGQRFDINRPFGNGRDDDGDGVVDEPDEYHLGEQAWVVNSSATVPWSAGTNPTATPFPSEASGMAYNAVNLAIDWNGNGTIDTNGADAVVARQQMAKYLYVMAMTLVDQKLLTTESALTAGLIYDTDTANTQYQVQYALAQWAINAVDFRDRDSIMTPFEFDVNPFNGWQVDGDITTTTDVDTTFTSQTVVWGCERPELLITETLAWHDRRTQDLATVDGGTVANNDAHVDFDQQLVPMPACFVELYNPWTSQTTTLESGAPAPAEVSGEFYNTNGGGGTANAVTPTSGVVLNALDGTGTSPVWRMIFVAAPNTTVDPDDGYPLNPNPFTQTNIDRTIYFVQPPATVPDAIAGTLTYYTSQPVAPLKPGRYAVVGSSGENNGRQKYSSKVGRTTTATNTNSDPLNLRQIFMLPSTNTETNQVWVVNSGQTAANNLPPEPSPIPSVGGSTVAGDAQTVVGVVVDTAATWSPGGGGPRSFGISDPQAGYSSYGPIATYTTGERYFNPALPRPIDGAPLTTNATTSAYRTVHLQRLANPQTRYNPPPGAPASAGVYNPAFPVNVYRTVDSAFIDLTAFNGITPASAPSSPPAPTNRFCSNQRGDQYASGGTGRAQMNQYSALWGHEPVRTTTPPLAGDPTLSNQIYNVILRHSIGYLNQQYGVGEPGATATSNTALSGTAYSIANTPKAPAPVYAGMPTNPFPWLTWNNRPFISPMELALVPKSRSSRLTFDYCLTSNPLPASTAAGALYNTQSVPSYFVGSASSYFGHLINFFGAQTSGAAPAANLYRLLEYVQVPSKFVGTDTILDPTYFSALAANQLNGEPAPGAATGPLANSPYSATNAPYMNGTSAFWTYFRPPFNKVSEYRDPGRVNINTVQDPAVWRGVLNGAASPQLPASGGTAASVAATLNPVAVGAVSPSYFSNPFRSFAGAALTNSIYGPNSIYANSTNVITTALRDIDATLLRPAIAPGGGGAWNQSMALFDAPSIAANMTAPNPIYPYNDPTRNPYFRLQNASRMSNLLTTRSNVYAVWVTVGYFQVTPWYGTTPATPPKVTYDTAHQDGYQLGEELGSDTGQIKRHRAFYLFDRTIPVGFERGVDHNVQNAILLRRFIE